MKFLDTLFQMSKREFRFRVGGRRSRLVNVGRESVFRTFGDNWSYSRVRILQYCCIGHVGRKVPFGTPRPIPWIRNWPRQFRMRWPRTRRFWPDVSWNPFIAVNPGRFGPGSFRPIFGVGRFGLSRWVVSALSRFGPISIRIEAVWGKVMGECYG